MSKNKIYLNETLIDESGGGIGYGRLLRENWVYAAVNTDAHEPLLLERHLYHAANSYARLHGVVPELDATAIGIRIRDLLQAGGMPTTGNIVNIYMVPPADRNGHGPDVIIMHDRTTIYRGYDVVSLRPRAVVVNYEVPFSGHRTAVSHIAARYMEDFAVSSGANIALRANRQGKLVSSGDYPVFAVADGEVFTPAPDRGPGESVERELMFRACRLAGISITERDIETSELSALDEIMVFDHTGIRCILSIGENFYYNLLGDRLEKEMGRIMSYAN